MASSYGSLSARQEAAIQVFGRFAQVAAAGRAGIAAGQDAPPDGVLHPRAPAQVGLCVVLQWHQRIEEDAVDARQAERQRAQGGDGWTFAHQDGTPYGAD